jgi:hypothetical protein
MAKDILYIIGNLIWDMRYDIYGITVNRFNIARTYEKKFLMSNNIFTGNEYSKIKFNINGEYIFSSSPLNRRPESLNNIKNFYDRYFPEINGQYYAIFRDNEKSKYLIYGYKYEISIRLYHECFEANHDLNVLDIEGIKMTNICYGIIPNINTFKCIIGYLHGKIEPTETELNCFINAGVMNKLYDNTNINLPPPKKITKYIKTKISNTKNFNITLSKPILKCCYL